ncbi:MAG: MCE family protein [Gordonia sp. (in: high G+C Gram-positive bacteria)]
MAKISMRPVSGKVVATVAGVVVVVLVAVAAYFGVQRATTRTLTAYFAAVNGLYTGDSVRIIGVPVGEVTSITPRSGDVRVTMRVDKSAPIPTDVRAVIVAQSLVSGRFVQLTPTYTKGPEITGDADIPMDRTAVPMEWDHVKKQLDDLSKALGPNGSNTADPGTAAKAIDVAAANLDGNGNAIAESIKELSTLTGTLADNRKDLFATVTNLQKLTDVLKDNHEQLVQFNGRMATVSSVLADSTPDLGDAMTNVNEALGDLQDFLNRNSASTTASMAKLQKFTKTLRDKDEQLRGLLHSAPNQLANFYNIYNPLTGSLDGVFGLGMGNNLITLLCGTMASTDRPMDSEADVEKCVDVLAPVLKDIVVNFPPFMANPVIGRAATQSQITYQNDDVRRRAQAGTVDRNTPLTPAAKRYDALTKLLLPFGDDK